MQHKVFISYHRKDEHYRELLEGYLLNQGIDYYAVSEDDNYDGMTHQAIKDKILENMDDCDILVCLVGDETYSRPHVDWEIHEALKGGLDSRLGIIAVMLEYREDSINNINYDTFPNRLQDNENYIILKQFASINKQLKQSIKLAYENSCDEDLKVNNKRKLMNLRESIYYDNW